MISGDTIAAISTTTAPSARIIVRVSGPASLEVADALESAGRLRLSDLSFPANVFRFKNLKSYTGEDLVEFHIPGNPILARMLLDEIVKRGARQAEPGEFTARAFFNGRMDITEAEGVAATIAATNQNELNAARKLMSGELARRIRPIMDAAAELLALVEAGIDFTEEDISFVSKSDLNDRLEILSHDIKAILQESARFEKISHEPTVVFIGPPNAGKSTLLNSLAGLERAIVSPVAGTTRDAISADVQLRRGVVRVIDVAGLESKLPDETDESQQARIDRQMQLRAIQTAESADVLVLVYALATEGQPPMINPRPIDLVVLTKSDLSSGEQTSNPKAVFVSAHTGAGMDRLREKLNALAFGSGEGPIGLAINARHVSALDATLVDFRNAMASNILNKGGEFIADELRSALDHLGQILGVVSPDDILGRIFGSFCIGK